MSRGRIALLLAIAALIAAFFAFGLDRYLRLEYIKEQHASVVALYQANAFTTAAAFFAFYVAFTGLSLPGAGILTLFAGAVFGLGWGTLIASFASSIGATIAFLASRFLFRDLIQARLGEKLRAVNAGVEKEGAAYLFALRLVPVFPFILINLLLGLTPMRTWTFYWVSQAGMFAGTLVYTNAGTQIARIDSVSGLVSPQLIGSLVLLGFFPLLAKKARDALANRRGGQSRDERSQGTRGRQAAMLSVIIPVLNEARDIRAALSALQPLRAAGGEIIVADGGSADASRDLARDLADVLIDAPRGRALQMNAGARAARGDILMFLHADTALPEAAATLVAEGLAASRKDWGRFDVRISGGSAWFPLIGFMMNWRSRLSGIATGDQALFVRRRVFEEIGGFPPLPLMEDVALSARLKRRSRPLCLRARVATSGRRWERHGVLRTIALMWWLRLSYFAGAPPAELARRYYGGESR